MPRLRRQKMPGGRSAATFPRWSTAKSGLDSMKSAWGDASNAATSGDYTTAVTKGQAVKDQASQIMQSLGMKS